MPSRDQVPAASGYRMPAEWAPHAATWMSWPFDDEMWFGHLGEVRAEYAELVKAIAKVEPVHLLLRDEEAANSAANYLSSVQHLTTHLIPLDDVWLRDNGAIFINAQRSVSTNDASQAAVNWRFNAWGGKYTSENDDLIAPEMALWTHVRRFDAPFVMEGGSLDVDGLGLALTTEQCLLTPTRNPHASKQILAHALRDYLGIDEVIWLGLGLEGDHTDGHVDTITRFAAPGRVLTSICHSKNDVNYGRMQENLEILKSYRGRDGNRLEVLELPLPEKRMELEDGTRLPPSYANFYICNGTVLVPQYHDPQDEKALGILRQAFPEHRVVGLASRFIIMGGGSFHCLTQQQPLPW